VSLSAPTPALGKATQFANGYSPASPFMLGPAQWHKAFSPQYKQFLEQLTDVMEQCAVAWDARNVAEARLEPDSGVVTEMSAGTVTAYLSEIGARRGHVDFLYLDEL
jgi:hypothetical protein